MKINPIFSLFSALILAFIFGFSLSSNFKFPYETNQFLSVSVDNNPLIIENEQNPASVSSDQIYEDLNNIDIEDRWKADDIVKMDVRVLPESDGAEINITAFSIYQTSEQIINNKSIPNINMTEGCLVEDVLSLIFRIT